MILQYLPQIIGIGVLIVVIAVGARFGTHIEVDREYRPMVVESSTHDDAEGAA